MQKQIRDGRKKSLYLPRFMLEIVERINQEQHLSHSRVMADCLVLVLANLDRLDWRVNGVRLQRHYFTAADRKVHY